VEIYVAVDMPWMRHRKSNTRENDSHARIRSQINDLLFRREVRLAQFGFKAAYACQPAPSMYQHVVGDRYTHSVGSL
jgi:hypothetical protein